MLWVLGGGGRGCGCLFGEGRCLCFTQLPWLHNSFDKTLLWSCCYCLKQSPLHPHVECWMSTPFSLASWRVLLFITQYSSSRFPAGRCLLLASPLPTQLLFFFFLNTCFFCYLELRSPPFTFLSFPFLPSPWQGPLGWAGRGSLKITKLPSREEGGILGGFRAQG